jgi:gliding motility-associated protein GldL
MAGKSRGLEVGMNFIVCVGAAIVIVGALFKILHWKGADLMLMVGLLTEAAIFLLYAFFPPSPEADLSGLSAALPAMGKSSNPALDNLDKMMQDADITPTNLQKLSAGFKSLGTSVDQIKDVSGTVNATTEFAAKTKEATAAIGQMTNAYTNASGTLASFNNAAESTKGFHEQVQVLTKNLNSLNTIYELELKDANSHLKSLNSFYGSLAEASKSMQGSVEDANKAKEQMSALANNLANLNKVYGNMLGAMSGR